MFHVAASNTSTLTTSRPLVWSRALLGLVILFLVVDAAMKIAALPIVAEAAMTIGWTVDPGFWRAMGLLLLAITALYAWPRIAVLSAILVTGYLAVQSQRMSGSATRSSATHCSGSIWASPCGSACGCVTLACKAVCRSDDEEAFKPNSTTADDDQPPRSRRSELARLDDEQHASIAWASRAADADD
jgi:hypothetical protein